MINLLGIALLWGQSAWDLSLGISLLGNAISGPVCLSETWAMENPHAYLFLEIQKTPVWADATTSLTLYPSPVILSHHPRQNRGFLTKVDWIAVPETLTCQERFGIATDELGTH